MYLSALSFQCLKTTLPFGRYQRVSALPVAASSNRLT